MFSKYARVETPDGEEVGLAANDRARGEAARRGFLSYIWEVAGRTALNQVLGTAESKAKNGAAGALEEDARLTALFLWTLQATDAKAPSRQKPVGLTMRRLLMMRATKPKVAPVAGRRRA